MSQAQSSKRQLAFIPEVTYGVTPATPQTQAIEFVTFDGELTTTQLSDPSIRPDRQTSYARRGNSSTEGTLEVVLAPDNYDVFLEAALQGTWTTNVLKIGSNQRSFAVEEGYLDIDWFRVFNGVVINTLSMEVTTDSLVTMQLGFVGKSTTAFSNASIDETPTPVPLKDKFFHEGGTFNEGGVAVGSLTAISWELNNNVSGNAALGTTGFRNVTSGKVNISGTVTGLFEDVTLYNKFKNDVDSSISYTLVAGAETMTFNFHRVKYTSSTITSETDAGVTVEMSFEALIDTGVPNTTLTITRSA